MIGHHIEPQRGPAMIDKVNQSISMLLNANPDSAVEAKQKAHNLQTALEEFEKQLILDVLQQNQWHREKTATMLGIDRKTLYTKMKKYGII